METPKQLSTSLTDRINTIKRDFIFVRHNNIINKVRLSEVRWINADGNYCFIHIANKRFVVKMSMKKLADKLSSIRFLRIHKSYIVQINFVEKVDAGQNYLMVNGRNLPIGRVFKLNLLKRLGLE